ncbi:MAG: 1-deoxy-D-xylulose-5-phosphate synthase [Bacillota bacterium]|nr:1-deoxy-D-xylulose-5-phosphate synthase [Bacillota bacterium]
MKSFTGSLKLPEDLKTLSDEQLKIVAAEVREYMIRTVADNGGHLAASLGVVELSIALHCNYNSPLDRIIWDVGHQSYPHKLLTGRWDEFASLRRYKGLCGFPKPSESEHDPFATGHSSTSISAALGFAQARDHLGNKYKVIAVIGDGALTGGMAYEALNHAGHIKANLMVILNDNKMSIGSNVGSMSAYLARLRSDPKYSRLKEDFEHFVKRIPLVGNKIVHTAERIKGGLKYLIMPGMLFEELGFTYFGPVDGHNIKAIRNVLRQADKLKGPVLVHVVTEKGKGYSFAEESPDIFHGVGPFNLSNGLPLKKKSPTYTEVFGKTMLKLAEENENLVAITAAMTAGTGLNKFSKRYPDRFYDVGIAEQHAVTMAAALASGGMRPVVAVYSTFLQRAFDQMLHDTCMQKLPVIFAIDRAGIVGEDGETHQGLFDLTYLRSMPNMAIMAPSNAAEMQNMLYTAANYKKGPVAIRYPRDKVSDPDLKEPQIVPWGKGELLQQGEDILLIGVGPVVESAMQAAERLIWQGVKAAVINARFVKPLDEELIASWALKCGKVITIEENILAGGFGSGIVEMFEKKGIAAPVKSLAIDDRFVEHGTRAEILTCYGLNAENIFNAALAFCGKEAVKEIN